MTDKELIKKEIERRIEQCYRLLSQDLLEIERKETNCCLQQYKELLQFIDSLPEESDLEEEIDKIWKTCNPIDEGMGVETANIHIEQFDDIAKYFAEWQRKRDEELFSEDTWNYIEENYPNITEEEKLRLYDISIKSRLAGANTFKKQMKEALQTEYEKGRFDMREEMMEDAMDVIFVQDYAYNIPLLYGNLKDKMDIVSGQTIKLCRINKEQQ